MNHSRRQFLHYGLSGMVLMAHPALAVQAPPASNPKPAKIVWVVLRGAMDSLHAIVPAFDPNLRALRADLVNPISADLLPLDAGFGLHPAFTHLHGLYQKKQFFPVVATASPYRSRSHFDGQDMLESGLAETDHNNGWLARAASAYRGEAIAVARSVPISLRGDLAARTWYPSNFPDADAALYEQLADLYQHNSHLQQMLRLGLDTRSQVSMDTGKKSRQPKFAQLARNCGELLAANPHASCAMLDMGGWDTHANQLGHLQRQFAELDAGIAQLQLALGDDWQHTLVMVATEFGRTAASNGSKGTDHGTASAMMILGGAVNGGRVAGRWPGLGKNDLYEGRDLQPTSDVRSWITAVLKQHWGLSDSALDGVFPGVKPAEAVSVRV